MFTDCTESMLPVYFVYTLSTLNQYSRSILWIQKNYTLSILNFDKELQNLMVISYLTFKKQQSEEETLLSKAIYGTFTSVKNMHHLQRFMQYLLFCKYMSNRNKCCEP